MAELERQRVATAQAAHEPLAGSNPAASALRSGVVELARRAVVTRESAGSSPAAGALMPMSIVFWL
jgi:hypothetical protein